MKNQEEVWLPVKGYEGIYEVSNLGNVKSLSFTKTLRNSYTSFSFITKEIILKDASDACGYRRVVLTKEGIRVTKKVHRLVAESFLNLKNKEVVNHIDFNRANNHVENLECCSVLENNRHSRKNNRYPKIIMSSEQKMKMKEALSIKVICIDTNIIYDSITDACKELGYKRSTLTHYLLGSRKNKTSLRYL